MFDLRHILQYLSNFTYCAAPGLCFLPTHFQLLAVKKCKHNGSFSIFKRKDWLIVPIIIATVLYCKHCVYGPKNCVEIQGESRRLYLN